MDRPITINIIHEVANYAEMIERILAMNVVDLAELARILHTTPQEIVDICQQKKIPAKPMRKKLRNLYSRICLLHLMWVQE